MNDKLLRIDLTTKRTEIQRLDQSILEDYIGGRGLGIKLLEEYGRQAPPLSPESPLILTTGLLANTGWPSAVQWNLTEKSVLTGGGRSSLAWGNFGIYLASLGYAAVVITGRSSALQYLLLSEDGVEFLDAEPYRGMNTQGFTQLVEQLYPGASNLSIGRAGESLVGISNAVADGYMSVLRGGGAAMGSKNLKALVVCPGPLDSPLRSCLEQDGFTRRMMQVVGENPTSVRLREYGKALFIESKNLRGDWPSKNFQYPNSKHIQNFSAKAMQQVTVGTKACRDCPIACIRLTRCPNGVGLTEGPELEPLWALGARIGNSSREFTIELYNRCLMEGVDPTGFGGICAFILECSRRGLLETGYDWDQPEAINEIWNGMIENQGIGGALRNGSQAFCRSHPECQPYAMQVKGVEMSAQECRQSQAFGLCEAVSNWGGCGLYSLPTLDVSHNERALRQMAPQLLPEVLNVEKADYKAELVVLSERWKALSDSFGLCMFSTSESFAVMPEDLAEAYRRIFGKNMTAEQLMQIGERIVTLERLYNWQENPDLTQDGLPQRFFDEPVTLDVYDGDRLKGLYKTGEQRTCRSYVRELLPRYYELHGWTDGVPDQKTLSQLGLTH